MQNTKNAHPADAELNAYVDGALTGPAAGRVRRHLAGCAGCAAEADALRRLGEGARSLYTGVPVPTSLLPAPPPPRRRRPAVVAGALAGAAVASLAAVGVWNAPGMPGRPRVAFADVERAMARVQNARWVETSSMYHTGRRQETRRRWEVTVRSEPPAIRRRPLPVRYDAPGPSIAAYAMLQLPDRYVRHSLAKNEFTVVHKRGMSDPKERERQELLLRLSVRADTLSPGEHSNLTEAERSKLFGSQPRTPSVDATAAPRLVRQPPREVTLDGRRCVEFRTTHTIPDWGTVARTVWVDPDTRRLVRTELRQTDARTGGLTYHVVTDGYRYNLALPASEFTFVPPPGTVVRHEEELIPPKPVKPVKAVWKGLRPEEKARLRAVVARSAQG